MLKKEDEWLRILDMVACICLVLGCLLPGWLIIISIIWMMFVR
jgi:hypothetical protein